MLCIRNQGRRSALPGEQDASLTDGVERDGVVAVEDDGVPRHRLERAPDFAVPEADGEFAADVVRILASVDERLIGARRRDVQTVAPLDRILSVEEERERPAERSEFVGPGARLRIRKDSDDAATLMPSDIDPDYKQFAVGRRLLSERAHAVRERLSRGLGRGNGGVSGHGENVERQKTPALGAGVARATGRGWDPHEAPKTTGGGAATSLSYSPEEHS